MINPFDDILREIAALRAEVAEIRAPKDERVLIGIKALANYLECSYHVAYDLKTKGAIPYKQAGRHLLFNTSEILQSIKTDQVTFKKTKQ